MSKNFLFIYVIFAALDACVDPFETELSNEDNLTIVADGFISDLPGPHTIRLVRISSALDVLNAALPVQASSVTIEDSNGETYRLSSKGDGIYSTSETVQGVVGHEYKLKVQLSNGSIIESPFDELLPVDDIIKVHHRWDSITAPNSPPTYGFKIFMDGIVSKSSFVRWRFTGAYEVQSYPELNKFENNCAKPPPVWPDPPPCSGFVYTGIPFVRPGLLEQVGSCSCCNCWVRDFENVPKVNDDVILTDGSVRDLEVGFVPFTAWTFGKGRYMVRVEQMSLSRVAFDFWKLLKDQKVGASSLFQPAIGKPQSNFISSNANQKVIGFFYATSIKQRIVFLTADDARLPVPPFDIEPPNENCALWRPCNEIFPNSQLTPPKDWK